MVRDAAPPHRMPLMNPRTSGAGAVSPRTTCIAANWPPGAWCWPTTAGSPCETTGGACSCAWRIPTRGDHAPTVVDVHGRMQDRACGANDDHAHGTACLFREGTGSADACLCLAPKLGGPSCGAADPDHHLASRLQSFQAPPRCHRPTSSASIPRKPCEWIRLSEVFRVNQLDCLHAPERWPDLQSFAVINTERTVRGKTSYERCCYLSSLTPDAARLNLAVRQHWRVENSPHWCMDVVLAMIRCAPARFMPRTIWPSFANSS